MTVRLIQRGCDLEGGRGRNPQLLDEKHADGKLEHTLDAHPPQHALPLLDDAAKGVVGKGVVDPLGRGLQRKCYCSNGIGPSHINILEHKDNKVKLLTPWISHALP